jgi:hypothetical protein
MERGWPRIMRIFADLKLKSLMLYKELTSEILKAFMMFIMNLAMVF